MKFIPTVQDYLKDYELPNWIHNGVKVIDNIEAVERADDLKERVREKRAYLVHLFRWNNHTRDPDELTNPKFIEESERQGNVLSLEELQRRVNKGNFNPEYYNLRIL